MTSMPDHHTSQSPRPIELLAPARNADIAIEAIKHGADAVYIGATSHGARAAAGNSLADIARTVTFAHSFGARVYVTLNTIIYPSELPQVSELVNNLYRIGVDALIVQDMALLQMDLPPIELHASTQCDIRTPQKARFLADVGFSQLVLPRELTLSETAAIHEATPVSLEAFVHGALCVSYSGDCQAGFITMKRSANRGECPQICRHRFSLTDAYENVLIADKHLLSLRDLNRSAHLADMLKAGISSFKIEGRLKDTAYIKNVVAHYRSLLDDIIRLNPDLYTRSSFGTSHISFIPDINSSFNRGFTSYFTTTPRPDGSMASIHTPKFTGTPVAKVISCSPRAVKVSLLPDITLANGDGLGYFDDRNSFHGFRVNRVEGNTIFPAEPVNIPRGTTLLRNHNQLFSRIMESDTGRRSVSVDLTLRLTPRGIALDACTPAGHYVSRGIDLPHDPARSPQLDTRRDTLLKSGDTIFTVNDINDLAGNTFIPRSLLASLRRDTLLLLHRNILATHHLPLRRKAMPEAKLPVTRLTYHDNVANPLARDFYLAHGATSIQPAIETRLPDAAKASLRVMTTRYCLRRELGHCLRTPKGSLWPQPLFLTSGNIRLRLDFDCANCRLNIFHTS